MSGLGHCFTHMKNHLLLSTSSLSSLVKIGGVSIEAPAISGWRGTDVWLSCFHATTAKPFFSVLWAGKDQGKVWTFLDENCFVESFFPLANCIYDVSICIYIYIYIHMCISLCIHNSLPFGCFYSSTRNWEPEISRPWPTTIHNAKLKRALGLTFVPGWKHGSCEQRVAPQ